MNTGIQLRAVADRVAMLCNAPESGVVVTVQYVPLGGWQYVIWNCEKRGLNKHCLWVSATPEDRLIAHVKGFIDNVKDRPREKA